MFPYQYVGIQELSHSIRLATLLPGHRQDTIRVNLSHIDFPAKHDPAFPLYESLSYAWGDADNRVEIYVDNRIITATRNLAEALVYLRHHEIPRVMWIDALCIDQGNMAERSTQVSRMLDIYSHANRVIVWLGPESDDSALAMDTLLDLSRRIGVHLETTNKFVPLADDPETMKWCDRSTALPLTDEQIDALCNLYKRTWFERLWIWQEIRLGNRDSVIRVGDQTMLWARFWVISWFLLWKRETGLRHAFASVENRLETINAMMNNTTQSPMQSLALRTCFSKCSEPRDRVYSLMGITTDETTITPDYALTVGDVYKDLVLQNLHQSGNLELLSVCNHIDGPRREMPTWVPDFRVPNDRKRWFDLDGAGEPRASATYAAPGILEAAGSHIDTIAAVHSLPYAGTDREIIRRLRELAPARLAGRGGGGTLEAYCRAFFANEFTDRYTPAGDYLFNFMSFKQARDFLLKTPADNDGGDDPEALAYLAKTFRIQAAGRLFFTTRSGHAGLAPEQARAGDEVVYILGCRWPLVLRPQPQSAEGGGGETRGRGKRRFAVVGAAYVDGANDREAILGQLPGNWRHVARWDAATMKWWPAYLDAGAGAGALQVEDPRLGPLPEGWRVEREHEEAGLWNWYVREGEGEGEGDGDAGGSGGGQAEGAPLQKRRKRELRWRSDPRLTVDALRERGAVIESWRLV